MWIDQLVSNLTSVSRAASLKATTTAFTHVVGTHKNYTQNQFLHMCYSLNKSKINKLIILIIKIIIYIYLSLMLYGKHFSIWWTEYKIITYLHGNCHCNYYCFIYIFWSAFKIKNTIPIIWNIWNNLSILMLSSVVDDTVPMKKNVLLFFFKQDWKIFIH